MKTWWALYVLDDKEDGPPESVRSTEFFALEMRVARVVPRIAKIAEYVRSRLCEMNDRRDVPISATWQFYHDDESQLVASISITVNKFHLNSVDDARLLFIVLMKNAQTNLWP